MIAKARSTKVSTVYISDEKIDGIKAQEWITNCWQKIDTVINLTGEPTDHIFSLCKKYNLDYIDTAFELLEDDDRTLDAEFQRLRLSKCDVKALIGFGMNPGLIEYIYFQSAPNKKHIAIELEYDTAAYNKTGVFNTWSPASYFLESIIYKPYFYKKTDPVNFLSFPAILNEVKLQVDGKERNFNVTPHEEVVTMGTSNRLCEYCAFLYQAPVTMQQFMKNRFLDCAKPKICAKDMENILTPGDGIIGNDIIGMMTYSGNEYLTYTFNNSSHSECSNKIRDRYNNGVNATSWQVACGVFAALEILDLVQAGIYTMSDISKKYSSIVEKVLSGLQFDLERKEFHKDEIKLNSILDIFRNSSRCKGRIPSEEVESHAMNLGEE